MTLQQVVEAMQVLQRKIEESKRRAQEFQHEHERFCTKSLAEQQRLRDESLVEQQRLREESLAEQQRLRDESLEEQQRLRDYAEASRRLVEETLRRNEELRKGNEDLRRTRQEQPRQAPDVSVGKRRRVDPRPFSQTIMDEPIPQHIVMPKIPPFSGVEDPETHLKVFQAQMLISRGSDAVRCKLLQATFTGTALRWFSGISDEAISSFQEFSQLFEEQFAAHIVKPPRIANLFDITQKDGEPLKLFLNRFCEISVCVQNPRDEMVVDAFVKGLRDYRCHHQNPPYL